MTTVTFSKEDFYRKMDDLLNVSPGSVKSGQALKTWKNWDSLTILEFMVLADSDYESEVQPADIAACQTVDDLAQITLANSALRHTGD